MIAALLAFAQTRLGAGVFLAVAALVGLALWGAERERAGRAAERARIEKRNQEARDATFEAYRSVDRCFDAGGVWDRAAGRCRPGLP